VRERKRDGKKERKRDGKKERKRENEERCDYQKQFLVDNDSKGKSASA